LGLHEAKQGFGHINRCPGGIAKGFEGDDNSAVEERIYRLRHEVENLFAKLKDWRRIATRYDRCAHTFFSAICIAATVIFWL